MAIRNIGIMRAEGRNLREQLERKWGPFQEAYSDTESGFLNK